MSDANYQLYYWPGLPGRGDFVRLVLEDAGVTYDDVTRRPASEGGGVPAVAALIRGKGGKSVFAPPILVHGELAIAQAPNVCAYLAERHGLVPVDAGARAEAMTLALTIADVVTEVHDTHHPIAVSLRYEDQLAPAAERAKAFCGERMAVWLDFFEGILVRRGGTTLVGDAHSYVDLSMYQLLRGLAYAFPRTFEQLISSRGGLVELERRVSARPNVVAYRGSRRALPFNEDGIFRRYPELDHPPAST